MTYLGAYVLYPMLNTIRTQLYTDKLHTNFAARNGKFHIGVQTWEDIHHKKAPA